MVQLEQLKKMGPMEPVKAKPVPCGKQIVAFIAIDETFSHSSGCIVLQW
jgi:hypothetical protein